jgi:hypothetical protein
MKKLLSIKSFASLAGLLGLSVVSLAQHSAALGPVEGFSPASSTIYVLGQPFKVDAATKIAVDGRPIPLIQGLRRLTAGQLVYIEGSKAEALVSATRIEVVARPYVAGSSSVSVLGLITAISAREGTITLSGLVVDTTTIAPELSGVLSLGDTVLVSGIQPASGGVLVLPTDFQVVQGGRQSVGGSGVQSVGGSGIHSVGGSGIQSVGGSGIHSVGGSGIQSVGGSGIQSVGGSGIQSVGGSGIQSVGGSGIQSVGGSGVQSVGGSGIQSVGGSGIQSVGGSGIQSVGGSGIQSVGGSGMQSVGGSGIRSVARGSVGGSGIQSVGGSGRL